MLTHIGCEHNGSPHATEAKRAVLFRFKRQELLYDIRNYAYIEGHIMDAEQENARHTLVDICEAGNVDRVTRILDVVHAGATEMLYPFTKTIAGGEEVLSDELEEKEEYVMELQVPATMSSTTLTLMHKLIHEYMVYRVMHDWLSLTHPEAARHWLEKAMEAQGEIDAIKNARTGVLTRKTYPY